MDILIVDDDKDLCTILTSICVSRDLIAYCIDNLKDALKEIDSFPMLMFLDNNLPDGLGVEMIETFKALSPFTKIVFITADLNERIMNQALRNGADYFLEKPFQLNGVRGILSKFQKKLINSVEVI
ncbi:MAG TPA: response regulator [Puia sp.]|jgi:DNA-binding response OmpR family regulator|nr:response regulator [Puia sp.]